MTQEEALTILQEMQKWRRGETPFDGDTPDTHRTMPYTPKEFGEAIDYAIGYIKTTEGQTINLMLEAHQLNGARHMLHRIIDEYKITAKTKGGKDDAVYTNAELLMIMNDRDNLFKFLCGGYKIGYRNHVRDRKGKLTRVEAFFM